MMKNEFLTTAFRIYFRFLRTNENQGYPCKLEHRFSPHYVSIIRKWNINKIK